MTERDERIQQLIDQGLMEVVGTEDDHVVVVLTERGRQMADWEPDFMEVQVEKNQTVEEVH